jgi:hypothetical protein
MDIRRRLRRRHSAVWELDVRLGKDNYMVERNGLGLTGKAWSNTAVTGEGVRLH